MARKVEWWVIVLGAVLVLAVLIRPLILTLSPMFYPADQVVIDGDDAFTAENGVSSGSGTQADPYILEGLDLAFSHPGHPCLKVVNTTAWFVIRDSRISYQQSPDVGDAIWFGTGLQMSNSGNASVSNLTFSSCGIRVDNCTELELSSNEMSYRFIDVLDSSGIVVSGNNRTVVTMSRCEGCIVSGNVIVDEGISLVGAVDCLVEGNRPKGSSGATLLDGTRDCVLRWNSLSGITMDGAYNCTVLENTVVGGGVECRLGANITIEGNEVSDCEHSHGISMWEDVTGARIVRNNVSNCYCGISLYGASGCVVYHNNVVGSVNHQVLDINGEANSWDTGYPGGGNYYSDYAGLDEMSGEDQNLPGPDGIGDVPYIVHTYLSGALALDRYPLMQPFTGA